KGYSVFYPACCEPIPFLDVCVSFCQDLLCRGYVLPLVCVPHRSVLGSVYPSHQRPHAALCGGCTSVVVVSLGCPRQSYCDGFYGYQKVNVVLVVTMVA